MSPASPRPFSEFASFFRSVGVSTFAGFGMMTFALAAWTYTIFPEWRTNADLSHGFFTPLLFLLLLKESRIRGPQRYLPCGPTLWWASGVVFMLSAVIMSIAALYAAAINWAHPLVLFLLGVSMTGGLVAAWLVAASDSARLIPFNWISGVAILLWALSLPIPPGIYLRLTLSMQLWITDHVLQVLHLFGIPAMQSGNIIELTRTTVGVEEACSGVRSLISCIYAGFFFSAAFVQRKISRVAILLLAPLFAILMNFVRSLLLTLLANAGIDITGTWHDSTGFAILGVTAVILGALAIGLEKIEHRRPKKSIDLPANPDSKGFGLGAKIMTAAFGFAVVWLAFFVMLTRPSRDLNITAPEVMSYLPESPDGWGTATSNGLNQFADILETDRLGQRTYVKHMPDGEVLQITFYLAYWSPGQTRVSSVAAHTPDACWPGAGWAKLPTLVSDVNLTVTQLELARAEYRRFEKDAKSQHVWFWHTYDREVIPELNSRRPIELLNSVLSHGVRIDGEQLFV